MAAVYHSQVHRVFDPNCERCLAEMMRLHPQICEEVRQPQEDARSRSNDSRDGRSDSHDITDDDPVFDGLRGKKMSRESSFVVDTQRFGYLNGT